MEEKVLILDFGSQYTQLIARRLRELNVYSEIHPCTHIPNLDDSTKAVILSGSPFSVNDGLLPNIDLSKYVLGYNNEKYIYELFGICNHGGGSLGGHYTSYVKNANQKWYCYNDTSVTEINETSLISAKAYCYCYRKIV